MSPLYAFVEGLFLILCFSQVPWDPHMDVWWHDLMSSASMECEPEWCDSEDELFILYTSGSTGKPKVRFLHSLLPCEDGLSQSNPPVTG